ncbi:MAG: GTP cyclohydrolase I FolE [Ostreibacterium sp.]
MSNKNIEKILDDADDMSDDHFSDSVNTPLRDNAFALSDAEKIGKIQTHFSEIMNILGMDMTDDSLKGTPKRVARMFVNELFSGLHPDKKPSMSTFDNKYKYSQMLVEKDITVYSTCEHHFLPIVGRAHIGYISSGRVVGLSKMNRIVDYFAKRPQVQERLTMQIVKTMQEALGTDDVACVIDAKHLCVNSRGIRDIESSTVTAELGGHFKDDATTRKEFLHYIGINTRFNV